jgi:SWI/SNF-related matrix-associated actin-dependent regulator 1 of chromatin subfamily A
MTNMPAELWTVLNLLHPKKFRSFQDFAFTYCAPKLRPWGWEYKGARNLKKLHRILTDLVMIRRLTKDVLKDLPKNRRCVVPIEITNKKEYQEASTNFLKWLRKINKSRARKAARAEKLVQIGYLKRLAARLKLKSVIEWIDNVLESTDGKLVVFGLHRNILNELHDHYKKISVLINGQVTGRKRQRLVDKFRHSIKTRILFGNLIAAGQGLNLVEANIAATIEFGWNPGAHNQAEKRINRIGQKKKTINYYLVAKGTIEEKLCKIIQERQKILSKTLDGGCSEDDIDILDLLEKELLNAA